MGRPEVRSGDLRRVLVVSDDTCACDMRHPDDDSPFSHHPYCIVGHQRDEPPLRDDTMEDRMTGDEWEMFG